MMTSLMPSKPRNKGADAKASGPRKVTSFELARKLGLARSTVTMALSDSPKINTATRLRVQQLAREMNYVPNSIARAMTVGRTNTLGLIMHVHPGEHIFRMVIGSMEAAAREGYTVKIIRSQWEMNINEMANFCINQCLAGVMVVNIWAERISALSERLSSVGIPLTTLLAPGAAPGVFSVWSDDAVGQFEAVEHLHRLGHRKIGFIGGNPQSASERLRITGFHAAMRNVDLPVDPHLVVECDFEPTKIERATRIILAPESHRPTALLCANDQTAMVVIRTARKLNISVPEQLSVIGFSNLSMAEYCDPPLTSIAQNFEKVGGEAAAAILRLIADGGTDFSNLTDKDLTIPSWLVVRESTGLALA